MSLGIVFENVTRQQRKAYRIDTDIDPVEISEIVEFWSIPAHHVWEDIEDSIKELNPGFRRIDLDCPKEAANHPDIVIVVFAFN